MSYPQNKVPNMPNIPPPPVREERKLSERDKNLEIESIKRTLYNALDKLERLKTK